MGNKGKLRYWAIAGAVLSLAGLVTPARAQDPDDARRGVARISMMNGEVSVRRGDSGDWVGGSLPRASQWEEDRCGGIGCGRRGSPLERQAIRRGQAT